MPIRFGELRYVPDSAPPQLGVHTHKILCDPGLELREIEAFNATKSVKSAG